LLPNNKNLNTFNLNKLMLKCKKRSKKKNQQLLLQVVQMMSKLKKKAVILKLSMMKLLKMVKMTFKMTTSQ